MIRKLLLLRIVSLFTAILLALPVPARAQEDANPSFSQPPPSAKQFSHEELAQLLAPVALYPDELVAQILMAATYPLEIVEADRWVQQNKTLKGDTLARALEQKSWDPSVKSLANFPSVLSMMSQKLEVTSKLGDAFLNQEADVMATIQTLRKKAYDAGNLTASKEQKVIVEKETIVIQAASPEVIYVPAYNPVVVYGPWMYPAYPPYPYYAYPPPPYGAFAFASGFAVGMAWGYAWGGCNWHGGSVNVNVWQNTTINNTYINRSNYQNYYQKKGLTGQNGQGTWRHDASHRKGVAYRDATTAQKYGQSPGRVSQADRDARGYNDNRRAVQPPPGGQTAPGQSSRDNMTRPGGQAGTVARPSSQAAPGGKTTPGQSSRDSMTRPSVPAVAAGAAGRAPVQPPPGDRTGASPQSKGTTDRSAGSRDAYRPPAGTTDTPSRSRDSAFNPAYGDGAGTRAASTRGQSSRQLSGGGNQQGSFGTQSEFGKSGGSSFSGERGGFPGGHGSGGGHRR